MVSALAPPQPNMVDFERQRRGAPRCFDFRLEKMRLAESQREGSSPRGILVKQVSEVSRRTVCRCKRE
jgi:hypothetical protein